VAKGERILRRVASFDHLIGAGKKRQLIAILLTGGETHDCTIAERLIHRINHRNACSATKPSAELRDQLHERGTKPVIPSRSNRKQPIRFSKPL
jgi:hypothetical protein